ncbi:MAG: Mov34/MPN/PAD-1 family protein [Halobacteriales archaeon]|nr:Mov34/MPN/PAD-1 family protein [Halobacteriales archaeon]
MGRIVFGVLLVSALAVGFTVFVNLDTENPNMWSGSDVSKIVVEEANLEVLEERYTPETERAWCLYGEIRDDGENGKVAVVEEIKWNSEAEGTRTSVEFDCIGDLPVPERTEYLGHVHSHPPEDEARPSAQDEAMNHAGGVDVMGIYNGERPQLLRWRGRITRARRRHGYRGDRGRS